ncbi:MAG: hypothetical protein R3225_11175 [Halofilum sp. (in: g-proteobacteria)]|nr:hypothetical protein [Halofilum sp. (in: g-proteobacteria)]
MGFNDLLTLWADSIALSVAIWLVLLIAVLYLARRPAHELLHALGRVGERGFRVAARAVRRGEMLLAQRNREVLLGLASESAERDIEREFDRVATVVSRDLSGYPALQRQLSQIITKIDEDYHASTQVPPMPPPWVQAIEAIANIEAKDPMVASVLDDIRGSLEKSSKKALDEYRGESAKRHSLLKRMLPYWRGLSQKLREVSGQITGLEQRASKIDAHMERYEGIRKADDATVRTLSSSSLTQFLIAGIVLVIATFGAIINFYLIALPMSEMVGGNEYIGPMRVADVAALVIIMVEITMGLFLMESLRITRLFPIVGALDDRMRRSLAWMAFTLLFILAGVESALAYMRDMLAADQQALIQQLSGGAEGVAGGISGEAALRWIPALGQMLLGFILPFALTFVAIPLESFIHAARTVLGVFAVGLLRALATLLRIGGTVSRGLAQVLIRIYDLVVFLPLAVERGVRHAGGVRRGRVGPQGGAS